MEALDLVRLNFSPESLTLLNITLGFIMFGVALDLTMEDFKRLVKMPKLIFIGLSSQLILLPLITFILVSIINPYPGFALGMFLIAACPGGNTSNFMSSMAKGNVALSVSLTAFVNIGALFFTPFIFTFWAGQYEPAAALLQTINLEPMDMVQAVVLILGLPILVGMTFANRYPKLTAKIRQPIKIGSILIFAAYILIAFILNFDFFLKYVKYVVLLVLAHNTIAFLTGYSWATLFGLKDADRRTITIETGIQNSGVALILIFAFFDGMGSMAMIAGWWGIWHLLAGMTISNYWSKRN